MFWERYESLCLEIGIAPTSKKARDMFGIRSAGTIPNWKANKAVPETKTLRRIAEAFNTSVAYLLGESPNRHPPAPPGNEKAPAPGGEGVKTREDAQRFLSALGIVEEGFELDEKGFQLVLGMLSVLREHFGNSAGG